MATGYETGLLYPRTSRVPAGAFGSGGIRIVPHWVEVAETRSGIGKVSVDRQPARRLVLIRKLNPNPPARPTRGRCSRIALKSEFGGEIQAVDGKGAL